MSLNTMTDEQYLDLPKTREGDNCRRCRHYNAMLFIALLPARRPEKGYWSIYQCRDCGQLGREDPRPATPYWILS